MVKFAALVEIAVPPVDTAYQSTVSPDPEMADKETEPVEHLDAPVTDGVEGSECTVAVAIVLANEIQPFDVSLTCA